MWNISDDMNSDDIQGRGIKQHDANAKSDICTSIMYNQIHFLTFKWFLCPDYVYNYCKLWSMSMKARGEEIYTPKKYKEDG